MLYVGGEQLNDAVLAMEKLTASLKDIYGNEVARSPITKHQWETIICGLMAQQGDFPDAVLPEGTVLVQIIDEKYHQYPAAPQQRN